MPAIKTTIEAREVGADGYGASAPTAVRVARQMIGPEPACEEWTDQPVANASPEFPE